MTTGSTTSSTTRRRPILGFAIALIVITAAAVSIPLLRDQRTEFVRETAALRAAHATAAQTIDSLNTASAASRATLTLERARAAAREDPKLHLVIAVDSGTVALVRDGITLRSMPARFSGGLPKRGAQSIAKIAEAVATVSAPTVDSLGNAVKATAPETKVERVTFSDGTTLEGGDAAAAMLGGVEVAPGPRMIFVSRRDFDAIRPNLVRGMKAVLF